MCLFPSLSRLAQALLGAEALEQSNLIMAEETVFYSKNI